MAIEQLLVVSSMERNGISSDQSAGYNTSLTTGTSTRLRDADNLDQNRSQTLNIDETRNDVNNFTISTSIANQEDGDVIDDQFPSVVLRMPNTAFGISMGLAGQSIMWMTMRGADFVYERIDIEIIDALNAIFWYASLIIAGVISICYVFKIYASFPLVKSEYLNGVRNHFFNGPSLIVIMLLIGLPANIEVSEKTLRILWAIAFINQILMTLQIYNKWMFSKNRSFSAAQPQYLLSTVGWFFLAVLGETCQIKNAWGIGLPQMCFGAGFILYVIITIFIFNKLHEIRGIKGSPTMFLLIAPPSVGIVSLDMFNDGTPGFSLFGEMLLGWVFMLLLLLIRVGPTLLKQPSVFGEYWAYVFPWSAATTATIRYASALQTMSTEVIALVMIALSILALFLVFVRMIYHMYKCYKGDAQWRDPLFDYDKYSTRKMC